MIENQQWAQPSLEQMAELQQGLIPREFEDEANLTPQARRIYNSASSLPELWPTAVAQDDNKSLEAHLAMKARMPGGPRSAVTSLQVLAKAWSDGSLWPTPYGFNGIDHSGKLGGGGEFAKFCQYWATGEGEWQTPTVAMTTGGQISRSGNRIGEPLLPAQAKQMHEGNWPTPTARDYRSGEAPVLLDYNARPLNEKVIKWMEEGEASFWPTPNALASNDGESPETWRARQERMKLKGYNGNGAGVPLAILAQEACLSSHPALDHFAGSPSPTTGPTCSPPSLPTGGSPKAAPTTPTTSRGGSLVRLNPSFVVWLMAGIEATDWGHNCQSTATALERTA